MSATAKNAAPRPSSHQAGSGRQRTIASAATLTTSSTRSPIGYDRLVSVDAASLVSACASTSPNVAAVNTAPAASELMMPSNHTEAGSRRVPARASMIRPMYASGYRPTKKTSATEGTGITVEIWDRPRIESERLGGLLGVAAGSDRDPRVVILQYRPEAAQQLLHDPQQRPAEEFVDLHREAGEHLEGDLVRGKQTLQRGLAAEQQEPERPDGPQLVIGLHGTQRFGKLEVRQVEQGDVAAALPDAAAEAVELQRIEIVPARLGNDRRRVVEDSAARLLRLHLVEMVGQALGPAAAA